MSVFRRIYVGEFVFEGLQDALTAHAGGTQAAAFQLPPAQRYRVTTVASPGDSVMLPPAQPGLALAVDNSGANAMQVFGQPGDKINGFATAVGVSQPANTIVTYVCYTNGAWLANLPSSLSTVKDSTVNSSSQTPTYAAANLTGGLITSMILTGSPSGGVTGTMDTTANIIAALPNAVAGMSYRLRVINHGLGQVVTLTAGDGSTTINGTATIATNTWRDFDVTLATASTLTLQSVGTGTES